MTANPDVPLQIREHPFVAVMGVVVTVSAATQLIWGSGGSWSRAWQLCTLVVGVSFFLRWRTGVVDVYADRLHLRSMFRADVLRFGEFSIRPFPFPRLKGHLANRAFLGLAVLEVPGRSDLTYLPVGVRPEVLQNAIDEAQGLVEPSQLESFRSFFGADYRYGRAEGWLRAKLL